MSTYTIASYDDIAASPQSHLKFCQMVKSIVDASVVDGTNKKPLEALASTVQVGGKPFSIAKHILALDMRSDEWDLFEADKPVVEALQQAHQYFKSLEPSYDTGGSILGFAEACERVGIDPEAKSAVLAKDYGVTFSM